MLRTARRLSIFTLVFLALNAAGLWVVHSQVAGRSAGLDGRLLDPSVVAGCVLLLVAYFLTDGLRLQYTLRALGFHLPFGSIIRLVFINIFVSNVTPLATGGGFAQVWYLRRRGVSVGSAAAATTIRTVLAILFIFASAPMFLAVLDPSAGGLSSGRLALLLAISVAVYAGFFAVVVLRARWLVVPLDGLVTGLARVGVLSRDRARRWRMRMRRELIRFARSFGRYIRGPRRDVALSLVFTALFLLSLFSFPAILLHGLGYETPYGTVVGLMVLTTFVMYFSPTPGASGIAEGTFGLLFAGRVAPEDLVQLTLAWRVLTIYVGMAAGIFAMQRELVGGGSDDVPAAAVTDA
ncbi:MAG: lysylphosphatidylglycerol synthase transmembrane domain-containing protein [Gemmatimonadota bacterium]